MASARLGWVLCGGREGYKADGWAGAMEASARVGLARLGSVRLGMAELEAAWLGGLARHTRADSVAAVRISARLLLATSQHGRSPDEQTQRVRRGRKRGQHAVAQVGEQVGVGQLRVVARRECGVDVFGDPACLDCVARLLPLTITLVSAAIAGDAVPSESIAATTLGPQRPLRPARCDPSRQPVLQLTPHSHAHLSTQPRASFDPACGARNGRA
ncbi:hypothetical protein L1887_51327 [Cichorium endivia]|nr:hypothetical protein L1887_51327 [Cichorium endivia]